MHADPGEGAPHRAEPVVSRSANVAVHQLDVFADRPFSGNPAAVCLLDEPAPEAWMVDVAREMGCPNTAFLHRKDGWAHLRW